MNERETANAKPPAIRELVGHVWVDSGQLVLTDPMYLEELDSETIEPATSFKQRSALLNEGMAAAFRSGVRNTKVPIYATRYENGALAKIEIIIDERSAGEGEAELLSRDSPS